MKKSNKIYLAYGSNLNLEQMSFRCPYAVPLGPVWLEGYRLLFRGSKSGAYATVEPYTGSRVPAILWEITPRDEETLDRYEGWPRFYRKETVQVEYKGKTLDVMAYIMNEINPFGLPSKQYLDVVRAGYDAAGFDHAVLDEAMSASAPDKYDDAAGAGKREDCLACSNSMSEPAENTGEADKLFCIVKQEYVSEDGCCDDFN